MTDSADTHDDTSSTDSSSDVHYRDVTAEAADASSLGTILAEAVVSAVAAYTRMVAAVVGAGWRHTTGSPVGQLIRSLIQGGAEAAVRESAPVRAVAGEWSQEQLSRVSAAIAPIVMDSIDVDAIAARIDSERVARQVGSSIASHLDVNAILADVDIDGVLERIDIEALVERIDVEAITRRIRFGALMVETTGEAAGSAIDVARRQAIGTNEAILRSMSRLLGRRPEDDEGADEEGDVDVDPVEEMDSA